MGPSFLPSELGAGPRLGPSAPTGLGFWSVAASHRPPAVPRVQGMDTSALLLELFGRIEPLAADVVDGLDADQLCQAPDPGANTIGWLVWHLSRGAGPGAGSPRRRAPRHRADLGR